MTTPICKIARENGGKVPLSCLFKCPHDCMAEHRRTNPPPVLRSSPPPDLDEFEILTAEAPPK